MAIAAPSELQPPASLAATGIAGLDDVLGGGFAKNRLYLVEGDPGAGKTTLALQYLLEGARNGEVGLYVTLSETKEELEAVANSHGWSLDSIHICELIAFESGLATESQYTMFHPSEIELGETTKGVLSEVERLRPQRVVFDSLSEMRLLAQNPLRYRRQILGLKHFFIGRNCTVLLLDDRTSGDGDLQLQSLAHGVLTLEQLSPDFGSERRRLRIVKMRGRSYRGGHHDFKITRGGLEVYPRIIAAEHHHSFVMEPVSSGLPALDQLLGGGLDRGTSALLMGPAGTGKSSVATHYAIAAAERGERAAIFIFDESTEKLVARSAGLGMPIRQHLDSGRITIRQIDPAELSPGELGSAIFDAVSDDVRGGAKVVVIDSLNGYLNAMPEERFLIVQLHELLTFLGQKGVVTLLVVAQHGLVGTTMVSPVDASYLADTILVFRYFEIQGEMRQALSVVKKRTGKHERTIRELNLGSAGVIVGEPLSQFRGIFTGVPVLDESHVRMTMQARQ